ncbi:MAG: acetyl-CoA synthase subunit gamma [bacterium]|nr:acetyl-CoA synthase subunit gamma [bacterium]
MKIAKIDSTIKIPDQPVFIVPGKNARKTTSAWTKQDYWGAFKSRISGFRMDYIVEPGLYALGNPGEGSNVFVSANYKLSFDVLRKELAGMDAWILVLDTKGINVWCAAGKGTFGTNELVKRINDVSLSRIVTHKRVIVPQLGGPGVSAPIVKKQSGFSVLFGPVQASDIPAWLENNFTATKEMRAIQFPMKDRVVLTPMELNPVLKKFPLYAAILLILFGLRPEGIMFKDALSGSLPFLILGLMAIFSGAFLTPALLPFIPFRSFAIKGWIMGVLTSAPLVYFSNMFSFNDISLNSILLAVPVFLFFPLASSYIALQFTGSTTFTGISGVKKELKIGLPIYIAALVISSISLIIYKVINF